MGTNNDYIEKVTRLSGLRVTHLSGYSVIRTVTLGLGGVWISRGYTVLSLKYTDMRGRTAKTGAGRQGWVGAGRRGIKK